MQPEQLGPFRIGRVIGRGGMGAVYEGVHEKTGEMAAVKVLLSTLEDDNELRLRFEAEIDTLKRLRHPNIVRLFGFGEEQSMLYYVMEMIDGPSLHQEIKRQRLFQWHEVAKIGLEMCLALKHGHDRGITHRDIKPANILLDQQGAIKLSDYGIAHFFGGQRLTEVNSVVGTLEYMSPEQSLANPVGPRSDLYSLGAVLYVLLVGKPPFTAKNLAEIVRKHQRNIVESIRTVRLDVPDELETIILDLLKIRPEERPGNAYLVVKRFQSLMQALVGPPERILVKPMTPDSPTHLPLEPARIPYRGDEDVKEPIGRPRGMVVENGIIDLGGIVEDEITGAVPPVGESGPEPAVSETEPDEKTARRDKAPPGSQTSLADSFGRPGSESDESRRTMGMTINPAKPTMQEIRPATPRPDPEEVLPEEGAPDSGGEITEMSPTQKTKVMTKNRKATEEPDGEATVRSTKNLQDPRGIRHGELYLDDRPEYRLSKDDPIPDYDRFGMLHSEPDPEELTKTEDDEIPRNVGDDLNDDSLSLAEDEPTIDGFGTNHRPAPAGAPGDRSSSGSLMEPYALQGPPVAATTAGVRNSESTLSDRSASHFVSVVDQNFDDFDEMERQQRPIVSLQTVLASCCLILIGLLLFYLLQPVPPDVRYERIVNSIDDTGSDEDAFIKSLRRAEKDIKEFLWEYSEYPKADQLEYYLEQLELDKLERDVERKIQAMDSKMTIPASQRAYIEAMASVKTDPERTIVKLKALIDLFQSDSKPAHEPEANAADDASKTPRPARSRFSRGTRDEDFVFLATRQLERLERDIDTINADQIGKLRLKLQHAEDLEGTNPERSDAIRAAIVELYQNKDWAEDIVREAREGLEH